MTSNLVLDERVDKLALMCGHSDVTVSLSAVEDSYYLTLVSKRHHPDIWKAYWGDFAAYARIRIQAAGFRIRSEECPDGSTFIVFIGTLFDFLTEEYSGYDD